MIGAALEEQRTQLLDVAESALMKLIAEGNVAATIFYLKTRGKERGYVERVQHVGITFTLTPEDAAKMSDEEIDAYIARCGAAHSGTGAAETQPPAVAAG